MCVAKLRDTVGCAHCLILIAESPVVVTSSDTAMQR